MATMHARRIGEPRSCAGRAAPSLGRQGASPSRPAAAEARGFTLVELVIVIAVIGILAAVAIPRFIDIRDEAYTAQRDGTVSAIRSGILLVASKNQVAATPGPGTFPPNLEATWGGQTGGAQPGGFPSTCATAAPCFELVLSTTVTDSRWAQTAAKQYTFTPPVGSSAAYTYDDSKGTFQ